MPQNVQFFWWFFVPKIVFWKKNYWVATTTDCFEPIFGFFRQFCFEKNRSASWSWIGMFSELTGRSDKTQRWIFALFLPYFCRFSNFKICCFFFRTPVVVSNFEVLYHNGDPQVRVFMFITWYKGKPAWTHALEGPHK